MAKLVWDEIGKHLYETGTRMGVLYQQASNGTYPNGVAWNGLRSIEQTPSGGDETKLYADDIKYLGLRAAEDFGGTIGAYTYPDEWAECDGSAQVAPGVSIMQQPRKAFGLCYRTVLGNDTEFESYGYKLHLVYNSTASPSSRSYETINDSPAAIEFSWEFSSTPVNVTGYKSTACLELDSTKVAADKLQALEAILYGSDGTATYTEFSGSEFADNTEYYTRSGTEGHYVYTKTSDDAPAQGTTYYTKSVSGATTARLPLPDEVFTILGVTATDGTGN